MIKAWVLLSGIFLSSVLLLPVLILGAPDREPLIMENADHMEGYRTKGEYILTGHVRFRHGPLRFSTERALWQRDLNRVSCEKGMRITHRGSSLTADAGSYDKNGSQALAQGHIFLRDSSGEMEAQGDKLTYDRNRRLAVLTGNPVARKLYPDTGKSVEKEKSPKPDTLTIAGRVLSYRDSGGIVEAEGQVVILRRDLRITCGHAEFRRQADSLILSQNPVVKVEGSEVKGLLMQMGLQGEEMQGMQVTGRAEANSLEKATDSTRARKSRVEGDSLFVAFKKSAIESVQVFRRATGIYFDVDRPDYVNRMSGDYMVMRFQERRVRDAEVLGSARSTYYHFERDSLKGKNQAEGDSIALAFREGKIEEVRVNGNSKGVYEGQSMGRSRKATP